MFTVLFTLLGAIYGIFQYADKKSVDRTLRVLEIHKQYLESKIDDSSLKVKLLNLTLLNEESPKRVVKLRCEFINSLIDGGKLNESKFDCNSNLFKDKRLEKIDLEPDHRKTLREIINMKSDSQSFSRIEQRNIFQLLGFYKSVLQCIDHKGCSEDAAFNIFSQDILEFLNATCSFLEEQSIKWNLKYKYGHDLSRFLKENNFLESVLNRSSDLSRTKLFICDYLN